MTEMNWYKASNQLVEVNKIFCPHCDEPFYEIDGSELETCPLCETSLYGQVFSYDSQEYIRIYVDHKSGELKVWGKDSDD